MIFIDFETTGLDKPELTDLSLQPYIIEITAIKTDKEINEIIDKVDTLIKPPVLIPPLITRINGIDDEMVQNSPTFIEIYPSLVELFFNEKTMVAHNCNFEKVMLSLELRRHDLQYKFPWPHIHVCTVEQSIKIKGHRLKLGELHEIATGKPIENAHRAINDVYAMIRCYKWMQSQGII